MENKETEEILEEDLDEDQTLDVEAILKEFDYENWTPDEELLINELKDNHGLSNEESTEYSFYTFEQAIGMLYCENTGFYATSNIRKLEEKELSFNDTTIVDAIELENGMIAIK